MSGAELILRLVDLAPRSLRSGAESVVVLYLWIRKRGSQAGFAAAVSEAVNLERLEVRRDSGFYLRLTPAGYGYLQQSPASDTPVWLERDPAEGPVDAPAQLLDILKTLNAESTRAVSPAALKQVWALCSFRSGDLRHAIDELMNRGELMMTAAELPGLVLTKRGRVAAGLPVTESSG